MKSDLCKLACMMLGLVMLAGCGGSDLPELADLNNSNIRRVHSIYKMYMSAHDFKGPKNEEELKKHCASDNTAKVLIERMGLDPTQLDDIFVSERDGQPFKIRWGLSGIPDHAIVFEAVGVEGKRLVALSKPRELDAAEYEGYWSGKIKPAAPGASTDIEPEKVTEFEPEGDE